MKFSVVIATLGRPDILKRTIDNVALCDPAPDEIIVVDGDEGRSSEAVTTEDRPFPVHYLTSPPGLPRQRNAGMDTALGDVVVFIDDDVEIPAATFSVLSRVYSDPSVLAATARIVEPATDRIGKKHSPARRALPGGGEEGGFTRFGYPHRLVDLETERDIGFMHGSFMSVRRDTARAVRFDENLPGYALAEDEDFSYRVSRRGRIRFVPELHVIHAKEGHSTRDARAFGRALVINRAYLFRKNFRRTLLARVQFAMLIGLFMGHRLVNREWSELAGLAEGSLEAFRRPLERGRPRPDAGKKRVAFVSSHSRSGGSEAYLIRLLRSMPRDQISTIVALEQGPLVETLTQDGHVVDVIPTTGKLSSIVGAARALRRSIDVADVDVIHANGIKAGLVAALSRSGVPFVWVKHDFSLDGYPARFVASRATEIVGVSSAVLGALTVKQRARARVVYTGIDLQPIDRAEARSSLIEELGAQDNDLFVGIVGRMHPVKGHADFIEAATRVMRATPRARWLFVGGDDGSFPEHGPTVRRLAQERLGDRAHFLGHRSDVHRLMAGLDVGVMTSHRDGAANVEALPLTAIEMLAVGTPVVAYASGGLPELLEGCGVTVPTGDVAGLADALNQVLQDRSIAVRLSECGPETVRKRFSTDRMIEQMLSTYSEAGD